MFASLFLLMGTFSPMLEVDIPVNPFTGKVDIKDRRPVKEGEDIPQTFSKHYHFEDGGYRCNHLGKFEAKSYNERNTGIIFEAYLEGYEKVLFLKDSEYTFKPMFGQEFPLIKESGSGVSHPDNISIVCTDKFVILTYLDGRKLVYENNCLKEKCSCGKDHYNLIKEIDERGNRTEYSVDKDHQIKKVTKFDINDKKLSSYHFKRCEEKKLYTIDLYIKCKRVSYQFKWMDKRYQFIKMLSGNTVIEEMKYKDKRPESVIDALHGTMHFSYKDDKVSSVSFDTESRKEKFEISYFGNTTRVETLDGSITYIYDENDRLSIIDGLYGYKKHFYYDDAGKLIKEEYIQNERVLLKKEYLFDSHHNLIQFKEEIDGEKKEGTSKYDHLCRKIEEINHAGLSKRYAYTGNTHDPTKIIISLDGECIKKVICEYDENRRLVEERTSDGDNGFCKIKRFVYKDDGVYQIQMSYIDSYTNTEVGLGGRELCREYVKKLDSSGKVIGEEHYKYDLHGNIVYEKNLLGKEKFYSYDMHDRLTEIKEPKITTSLSYLDGGNLSEMNEALSSGEGISNHFVYDKKGKLTRTNHSINGACEYAYDGYGRITKEGKSTYLYDILNRVTSKIDSEGMTSYEYGMGMDPTAIFYPDGSYYKKERVDERVYRERDKNGVEVIKTYDKLGNMIKEVCGDKVYTYEYKGYSLHKITGPEGLVHTYTYDGAGRVIREEGKVFVDVKYDCFSNVIYKKVSGKEQTFSYDAENNVIEETICGRRVTNSYDEDGNICKRESGGCTSTYEYDGKQRKEKEVDSCGSGEKLEYFGRTCKKSFSTGNSKLERYDLFHNLIFEEVSNSYGKVCYTKENYFNSLGRCIKTKFTGGEENPFYKEIGYVYNNHGKLLEETILDRETYKTRYEYNDNGSVKRVTKPDGVSLSYCYDEYGRVCSVKSSDRTIHYMISYDLLDRIISVEDRIGGADVQRTFDISGNLIEEKFKDKTLRFFYKNGVRVRCKIEGCGSIEYQYEKNGKLSSIDRYGDDGGYRYSHQYEYSSFGQVSKEYHPLSCFQTRRDYSNDRCIQTSSPFHYQKLHIENNLVRRIDGKDDSVHLTYDRKRQLMKEGEIENSILTFDACGRASCDGVLSYEYDGLDRIIKVTKVDSGECEKYTYDYFGRIRKKETKNTYYYLYDGENEIAEYTNSNIKSFAVIDYKTSKKVAIEVSGKLLVPLYDLFGSITFLVNEKKVVERIVYDSFGKEINSKGEEICPWRYKGLRRYCYNSLTPFGGRSYHSGFRSFFSRDPLKQSFHLSQYLYCYNNPLSYEDIDGLAAKPYEKTLRPLVRRKLQEGFSFDQKIKRKLYFVNGLNTKVSYVDDCLEYMEQFFNQRINRYYRPSKDSIFGVIAEIFGSTKKALSLSAQLKADLHGGIEDIYLFGHSAGGVTIKRALGLLSKEEREKINVITFGSAALINPLKVKSSASYYSSGDYLLILLSKTLYPIDSLRNMEIIPSKETSRLMDHSLMNLTYRKLWIQKLSEIKIY